MMKIYENNTNSITTKSIVFFSFIVILISFLISVLFVFRRRHAIIDRQCFGDEKVCEKQQKK